MAKYFKTANVKATNIDSDIEADADSRIDSKLTRAARLIGLFEKVADNKVARESRALSSRANTLGADFVREEIATEYTQRAHNAERANEAFSAFLESRIGIKIAAVAEAWIGRLSDRAAEFEQANRQRSLAGDDRDGRIRELHQLIEIAELEQRLAAVKVISGSGDVATKVQAAKILKDFEAQASAVKSFKD